jgi:hypothetical protein
MEMKDHIRCQIPSAQSLVSERKKLFANTNYNLWGFDTVQTGMWVAKFRRNILTTVFRVEGDGNSTRALSDQNAVIHKPYHIVLQPSRPRYDC